MSQINITQAQDKINNILDQLEGVRKSGRGYIARCPAHSDRHPSLSITQGEDGKILLYCFSGCSVDEICKSLGINLGQLFPDSEPLSHDQKKEYQRQRKNEKDFIELRRRAFIAMCEFRDLTLQLYDHFKLDAPADLVWAVQRIPAIDWYLEILTTKTSKEQIELLREGVLTRWARLFHSQNPMQG